MRTETVTESQTATLKLANADVVALRSLGSRLASSTAWWGAPDDEVDRVEQRSVISCEPTREGQTRLTVRDAIGVVRVPGLQIEIRPKIPLPHFMELAAQGGFVPRVDDQQASLSISSNFWDLVARWYVAQLSKVLRADLIRDYRSQVESLSYVTGRVIPMPTTRAFYAGRLELTCEYELFDTDTATNRVLKAAARAAVGNPSGSNDVRRHARRLLAAMDEVGPLQHGDLAARPDARTAHYDSALTLARNLLTHQLRSPEHGAYVGWSFLVRTPELIEAGIRHVLADRVRGTHVVSKSGIQLAGSKMRLTPDLVVDDGDLVGDVKYKLFTGSWNRPDLYQLVAFATGFRTRHAALVCFDGRETSDPPADVSVGDVNLRILRWRCGGDVAPTAAAAALGDQFTEWIDRSTGPHAPSIGLPALANSA